MRLRPANRLPRKPFLATRDPGYYRRPDNQPGPGLQFASGPFERKRFHTYEEARDWAGPEPTGRVHRLEWVKQMIERT